MKTFTIEGIRTLEEHVTYTVEAETLKEAKELIESGEIENNDDYWQTEVGGGEELVLKNVEE